jgi:hypothetical protein
VIKQFAIEGDRIAVLRGDDALVVKEGPLDADWVLEAKAVSEFVLDGFRIGVVSAGRESRR